jgi:hypothetical protein
MNPPPNKNDLVIEGNADTAQYHETVALLDRSGLTYRIGPQKDSGSADVSRLRCGEEILTDLSKDKVVGFLWKHGAQFEDS